MGIADAYLTDALRKYAFDLEEQKKELSRLPEGRLTFRNEKGHIEFVHSIKDPSTDCIIRRGITKDSFRVRQLARKKYLETSIDMLENEIRCIKKYLSRSIEPTAGNILKNLPQRYKNLPEMYFFPQAEDKDAWADEKYEMNGFEPEKKIHITSRGLHVRSKGEAAICEKLYEFKVPFRYEQMLYIENRSFSPDFTIKTRSSIIYWEHCGMMNIARYRSNNKWKLSMYEKAGIVPWKNLIITYDMEDGGLNMAAIEGEIRNKILIA